MKYAKSKIFMALVMMITILTTTTAFAAGPAPAPAPRWSHLTTITADMEVDNSGWATITVMADADCQTVTSIKAKCQLQQYDGSWKTLKTWTESNDNCIILYSKNYAIPKNYSYRLRVTAYAYKNTTLLESSTVDFDYGYYN